MFSIQNVLSKCKGCQNFERERERQEKTTNGSTFVNCHGENIVNFVQQK